MAETCFPVFQEGQTLTRDDLTLLLEFFDERARQVARAIGFGISCGLDGTVTSAGGDAVVIDAGVGIEHVGEVLTLEAPVRIDLPPASTETGFDFVDAGPGGFTAVLVAREEETPAPDCNEEGCEGHAATRCRTAELVMVPGRLSGAFFDFSSEPLLQNNQPLTANPTASAFTTLRNAIATRLDDTLSVAAKAKLASISIAATDLPATINAKAAFLNQVLFAALDLLRCRALLDLECLRETAKPGVALGWAHQVGGAWQWDCDFRHAWEPPAGLSIAFAGGACDDACKLHRDRLESLILTFELPPVPAPDEGPKPGGEDPDPYFPCGKRKLGNKYLIWEDCGIVFEPPERIPDDWFEHWVELGPFFPPKVDPRPPWEIYVNPVPDYFDEGLIDLTDAFGRKPENVQIGLGTAIEDAGLKANVQILTLEAAEQLPGFMLSSSASPADTIVLIKDQLGKVTHTGVIAAQTGFRDASVSIPAATAAATEALETANGLKGAVDAHGKTLEEFAPDVELLLEFREEALGKFDTADGVFSGLDERISDGATQVFGELGATIATLVDGAVVESVNKVQGELNQQILLRTDAVVGEVREQLGKVDERAQQAAHDADRSNERIDQVLGGRRAGLGFREIGRQAAFNEDLVGALRSLSDAIEATAPAAEKAAVREQLVGGRDALDQMEAGVRAGALVLQDEREPLSQLLDSLVGALKAAGASAAQLRQVRASVRALQEKLQ